MIGFGRSKIYLIKIIVIGFSITFIIYTVLWIITTRTCVDVFHRPFERHKMRVKPIEKHTFPLSELETNDYKKLINTTDFKFIMNNGNYCDVPDVFLLVLVPSAVQNKRKRDAIRNTWGRTYRNIVIVFLLGYNNNHDLQIQIKEENALCNDIVQGSIFDTYKNLTYKTVMSLKFAIYHCPEAKYILKIDDDSFVNLPLLINFLRNDISPFGAEELFLCNDMTGSPVLRDNRSTWYVSEDEYAEDFYPSYCSGWYVIFSPDVCFKLYREAQKQQKYLFVEDAFVYGIAAKGVPGLTHTDISQFTLAFRDYRLLFNGTFDNMNIMFGTPNMSPGLITKFWNYFRDKPVPVSIYRKI